MSMRRMACWMLLVVLGCGSEGKDGDRERDEEIFDEHHPGTLVLTAPPRAAFISDEAGAEVTVSGTGASDDLEINGQPVTPAADGSFETTIVATEGLNLIRVVDGEQSLDSPFLYGRFVAVGEPVDQAVALRVNADGYDSADASALSLTTVAQRAVDDIDLLAPLVGKTYTGSIPGGSWTYVVEGTSYGDTQVKLAPRAGGAKFAFSMADVRVDGELTVKVLLSKTDKASLSADEATIQGNVDAGLEGGQVAAQGSGVKASLENFRYDSNNAGFPCCVDSILTDYLRPKVTQAVQNEVRDIMQQKVAVALNQLGLPATLELPSAGIGPVAIEQRFDGASFELSGTQLSAAVHFSGVSPSFEAPGWLAVGSAPGALPSEPALSLSVSLDALNQALFAAWSVNGLARTLQGIPVAETVDIVHALPPVVLANDAGGLTVAAGEIVIDASFSGAPVKAALSIVDDVIVGLDATAQTLVLTPSPTPAISVTWLDADALTPELRDIIKATILEELPAMLTPISLPLPSLPLGSLASSFGSSVGALGPDTALAIDSAAHRIDLSGRLVVVP